MALAGGEAEALALVVSETTWRDAVKHALRKPGRGLAAALTVIFVPNSVLYRHVLFPFTQANAPGGARH